MSKKKNKLAELAGKFMIKEPVVNEEGIILTPRWSTGIQVLDVLTNGGFPKGKVVAFGAEEGVGKTTIMLQVALNQMEKYGTKTIYIDSEGSTTFDLIGSIGITYKNYMYHPEHNPNGLFYLYSAQTIQEISTICSVAFRDPEVSLVVIDSTTQVADETSLEQEDLGTGKNYVGESARMWSSVMKKLNALVNRSQATLVLLSQARNDLSGFHVVMRPTGGKAIRHAATIDIWGVRRAFIGEGDVLKDKTGANIKRGEAIGAQVQLVTLKNRLGFPFRTVDAYIYYGKGLSNKWAYRQWLEEFEVVDEATGEVRPVLRSGAWPSLLLSSGEKNTINGERARGNEATWALIEEYWDEIIQFVEDNGGFVSKVTDDFEYLND